MSEIRRNPAAANLQEQALVNICGSIKKNKTTRNNKTRNKKQQFIVFNFLGNFLPIIYECLVFLCDLWISDYLDPTS